MKPLILVIAALLVIMLGLGIFLTSQNKQSISTPTPVTSDSNPTPTTSTPTNDDLLQGGSSYSDPDGVFTFLYPNDWKTDSQNDGQHTRIYKYGATQTGQTEMFDGILMVFEPLSLNGKTLSVWVDDYIKSITADGTSQVTKPKKAVNINNYPGFAFSTRGLGEADYIVVQKTSASPNAVLITTLVADPENVGFQSQVESVLSTLQVLK